MLYVIHACSLSSLLILKQGLQQCLLEQRFDLSRAIRRCGISNFSFLSEECYKGVFPFVKNVLHWILIQENQSNNVAFKLQQKYSKSSLFRLRKKSKNNLAQVSQAVLLRKVLVQ